MLTDKMKVLFFFSLFFTFYFYSSSRINDSPVIGEIVFYFSSVPNLTHSFNKKRYVFLGLLPLSQIQSDRKSESRRCDFRGKNLRRTVTE